MRRSGSKVFNASSPSRSLIRSRTQAVSTPESYDEVRDMDVLRAKLAGGALCNCAQAELGGSECGVTDAAA